MNYVYASRKTIFGIEGLTRFAGILRSERCKTNENLVDLQKSEMLQDEYLVTIVAVGTAENEPLNIGVDMS